MMRSGLRKSLHVSVRLEDEPVSAVLIEDPNRRFRGLLLQLTNGWHGQWYTSTMPNGSTTVRIGIGENLVRSNPDLTTAIPDTSVIIPHYDL